MIAVIAYCPISILQNIDLIGLGQDRLRNKDPVETIIHAAVIAAAW